MKHLFTDEHETYTDVAAELDKKVMNFLAPLVKDLSDQGYSLRDVAFVLDGAVSIVVAGAIVKRNMEKRKEAREALKGAR